jgi:hypothetical protein
LLFRRLSFPFFILIAAFERKQSATLFFVFTIINGKHSGFMVVVCAVCIIFATNRLLSFSSAQYDAG